MTDDQIIEAAMQGHASARDAIRWAMKQVRMQANTHQLPSVSKQNTHKPDAVVRQLVDGLAGLIDFIEIDNLKIGHVRLGIAKAALAAAKEVGL